MIKSESHSYRFRVELKNGDALVINVISSNEYSAKLLAHYTAATKGNWVVKSELIKGEMKWKD